MPLLKVPGPFGKYQVTALLGAGGSGEVYRAKDNLDRQVALKVLFASAVPDSSTHKALQDEARNAASVRSEHVALVYAFEDIEGWPTLVSEFIEGPALRDVVPTLPFAEKEDVARQLIAGIQAIHQQGLIHRDLKPENVKLTSSQRVKILDFGLAAVAHREGESLPSDLAGTLHYMAPERLSGDPINAAVDIFSYGVILYEMFTGTRPFEAEFIDAIPYAILTEHPRLPSALRQDLPPWVDRLVLNCLQKAPKDRLTSAEIIEFLNWEDNVLPEQAAVAKPALSPIVVLEQLSLMSSDAEWKVLGLGFQQDLAAEIGKRTDVRLTLEGTTAAEEGRPSKFRRYRCDFLVSGTLQKWQDRIKLGLSVYSDPGDRIVCNERFVGNSDQLFDIMNQAAEKLGAELASLCDRAFVSKKKVKPTSDLAYDFYLRGLGYYRKSRPDDLEHAIRLYERALEFDPNMALARTGLSDVYAFQFMSYLDRRSDRLEKAEAEAKLALEASPDLAEAHRSLGRCRMFAGQMDEARACFDRCIELKPDWVIGYRTLAWLHEAEGDFGSALKCARRGLVYEPNDVESLLLIGIISIGQHRYVVAQAHLQRAIELAPDYGRAYYWMGQSFLKMGVLDQSLEYFTKAIKYTGDTNSHVDTGYVHLLMEDYDSARFQLQASIEQGHFPFVAHYYLALIDRIQGNRKAEKTHLQLAMESVNKYSTAEENQAYVQAYRALICAAIGDADPARQMLDEIRQSGTHSGDLLYTVARVYAVLGDRANSDAMLDRAMACPGGPSKKEIDLDPHFWSWATD